jgi:hypothetical protein
MGEIEHGVVSPEWVSKAMGYPDDARKDTVMNSNFVPVGSVAQKKLAEELRRKVLKRLAGEGKDA